MYLLVEQLRSRAESLVAKFKQEGGTSDIDEAIALDREALELCPSGHPKRSLSLTNLAIHLWYRYKQFETMDLEEAITLAREGLDLCPPGHSRRSMSLKTVALCLATRYEIIGTVEDLDAAIVLDREALNLCPCGHPDRSACLNNLAVGLLTRYKQLGSVVDLDEAIILCREALQLCTPGHHDCLASLNNLAANLSTRYKQLGMMVDLDEAIVLGRERLKLNPQGHPGRSLSLNNLAVDLSTRFKQLGSMADLAEAISFAREALELFPPGHTGRSRSLTILANRLFTRYEQLGATEDLDEAIVLDKEALQLCLQGHPDRPGVLNNLALRLSSRWKQLGRIVDLDEAIVLNRKALELLPDGHPDRSASLNNLALDLSTRYNQLWTLVDLDEAIVLNREAVTLCPQGHPDRPVSLNNLVSNLWTRYNNLGEMANLDEAIPLSREALKLHPEGHPHRSMSLNNLANCLWTRYSKLNGMPDLEEAILLNREALKHRQQGHPDRPTSLNNLAYCLSTRYKQLGAVVDLDEAIVLDREALQLRPPGRRSYALHSLTDRLRIRYTKLMEAQDQEELFNLYANLEHDEQSVALDDLTAAGAWVDAAEHFHHPTAVLAYNTFLQILTRYLATLPSLPQHLTVLKKLTSSLAMDAFSACLRGRDPAHAVELLEQGRAVFWSQLTRLRSPLDDVIASGPAGKTLADEFMRLSSLIRSSLDLPLSDQHERVCHLNVELQQIVTSIRELPGLSRFLLPLRFSDLQCAASEGPIIVVNASKYSCDALVVFADQDPVHIPLSITGEYVRQLSYKHRTLTVRATKMNVTRDLGLLLRELWDKIVSPIFDFLQPIYPRKSRVWWCPTAEFSILPLHAAGPYRKGQPNFDDVYVSSYTPTLAALIHARRSSSSDPMSSGKRFVAIGQAKATGESELHSVGTELANIGQWVDRLATFTQIQGPESCISRVTEELAKSQWVHLACHGLPNRKQPFESAFALYDGRFTIEHIIRCNLENPEFAYLSACHTTVGDEESPDEVIHLASALQFAGFRSVIGTMWAVDDGETNKITSTFYRYVVDESGRLEHTRAAYALNRTMKSVNVPLDQRILYIHLGA